MSFGEEFPRTSGQKTNLSTRGKYVRKIRKEIIGSSTVGWWFALKILENLDSLTSSKS